MGRVWAIAEGECGLQYVAWLVFTSWVISYANGWEDHSNYFGKISRIGATAHSWSSNRELPWCLWVCHLACWCITMSIYWGLRSSRNWLIWHLGPIWLQSVYAVSWAMLFFFFPLGGEFPTTTNHAAVFPTFREIAEVSTAGVQWMSPTLEKLPLGSLYLPCQVNMGYASFFKGCAMSLSPCFIPSM